MSRKTYDEKDYICYKSDIYWIDAQRVGREVTIRHARPGGQPDMTLNQMDRFADKLKQLVQDARKAKPYTSERRWCGSTTPTRRHSGEGR